MNFHPKRRQELLQLRRGQENRGRRCIPTIENFIMSISDIVYYLYIYICISYSYWYFIFIIYWYIYIYLYTPLYIYIKTNLMSIYIWANYNDLTVLPNPGIVANKGNHPKVATRFRLVKDYELPRYVTDDLCVYIYIEIDKIHLYFQLRGVLNLGVCICQFALQFNIAMENGRFIDLCGWLMLICDD